MRFFPPFVRSEMCQTLLSELNEDGDKDAEDASDPVLAASSSSKGASSMQSGGAMPRRALGLRRWCLASCLASSGLRGTLFPAFRGEATIPSIIRSTVTFVVHFF